MRFRQLAACAAILGAASIALGCSSSDPSPSSASTGGADPFADCAKVIAPGADDQTVVQTAFIEVAEDSVLCLDTGTFHFTNELDLDKKGVTVRGTGKDTTVLEFTGQTSGGEGIRITSDGVTLQDLTVLDTPGDGIRASDVNDIAFVGVKVAWTAPASLMNGAYGLYPVGCTGVTIDTCEVTGARDAGVYVGQSSNIVVTDCDVHGNVAGIEIENSTDAEVKNNHSHDNVGGVLVFNLPNLPVEGGKRADVHDNIIESNNQATFADPGSIVAKVPVGIGVIVLASDDNVIRDNDIKNNDTSGVVVVSYLALLFGGFDDPNFDPYPQGNWVHDNKFSGNGKHPSPLVMAVVPGSPPVPDLLWDGCTDPALDPADPALANCVSSNGKATYMNADLCSTPSMPKRDISKATCEH